MTIKSERNKTLELTTTEKKIYSKELITLKRKRKNLNTLLNKVINQDFFEAIKHIPSECADLIFVDPPYNLTKSYNGNIFKKMVYDEYFNWVREWIKLLKPILKENGSMYICGDWRTSSTIHQICMEEELHIMNRITFAREKGRGSNKFWKNNSEDIWFVTKSNKYTFNADAVKQKKKVIAPYKEDGKPKDWDENGMFRLTSASNMWTDITIPFWSMSENTPHPTQKPEKVLAKIILASSNKGDIIFDPFSGVGTTAVVAKKLGRDFIVIEQDKDYCLYSLKRLEISNTNKSIQGYKDGYFLDRNFKTK